MVGGLRPDDWTETNTSIESNLEIMVDSGSIEVVCAIVTKILSEDDNEKLLIYLLRTLINCALAIQALPIPRTPGQIYTQRSIQNTCHQVSNAPHSEQIADRLEKIQSAFNEWGTQISGAHQWRREFCRT